MLEAILQGMQGAMLEQCLKQCIEQCFGNALHHHHHHHLPKLLLLGQDDGWFFLPLGLVTDRLALETRGGGPWV